jgi:hypothetical protein
MSQQIWSSSSPSHIQVTVTVTNAAADTYADSEKSSVTVKTDNNEVTLHNGESQTFEDTTASVWLYENPGYDHNYYSYYGIRGTWEITTTATGLLGNTDGTENSGSLLIIGAVIAAAVIVGLILLLRSRKHRSSNSLPSDLSAGTTPTELMRAQIFSAQSLDKVSALACPENC